MPGPHRRLPAVHRILEHPSIRQQVESGRVARQEAAACVRQVLDELRALPPDRLEQTHTSPDAVAERAAACIQIRQNERLQRLINATGVILHTNLGRAVLSGRAAERVAQAVAATNVEIDRNTGRRSRRGVRAESLLTRLTGAEAALIVNNCAAATMLALQGTAAGKEVIISRGQLVEIGGGFRLPDVFRAAGVILKEVGTANRTRIDDYRQAITSETGAVLRVHRSNFRVSGFVSEPESRELVSLCREHSLPFIDDLGSGCLTDLRPVGLQEPVVSDRVAAGADLVLFSGDKLLGGPQAGILLGSAERIDALRQHPLARALRVCKLTLAALEATLEQHLAGDAFAAVPALTMLAAPAADIRRRCEQIVCRLPKSSWQVTVEDTRCEAGGGCLAGQTIPGAAVRITCDHPQQLLRALRTGPAGILGRIENGGVLLDLRSVCPDDDRLIEQELRRLMDSSGSGDL